jgi:hypothetical protein
MQDNNTHRFRAFRLDNVFTPSAWSMMPHPIKDENPKSRKKVSAQLRELAR